MKEEVIATEYARVIFRLSDSGYEQTLDFLRMLTKILTDSDDLQHFINHPAIANKAKTDLVLSLAKQPLPAIVERVLCDIVALRMTAIIPLLVTALERLSDESKHIQNVAVASSVSLSTEQKQALIGRLSSYLQKQVRADFKIDPELLSGFVIKIGNMVIDNSLVTELNVIRNQLMAAS
jgi:F-type H+-transporting ATPase subunit delta